MRHRTNDGQAVLFGRRGECVTLNGLVAGARAGQSQVLVVRGEAGIGKSALLDYLETNAAGLAASRGRPVLRPRWSSPARLRPAVPRSKWTSGQDCRDKHSARRASGRLDWQLGKPAACQVGAQRPAEPSIASRSRSPCPLCRAYSSTRCCHIHRTEMAFSRNMNTSSSFAPSSAASTARHSAR
jgi:hypothetical protein